MDQRDRTALQAAIEELLRLEPTWDVTIVGMLQDRPWEDVGLWAAICCQVRSLGLRPHECAPAETSNVAEPRDCYGARASEVALLRRMLTAGVSRFDPDPAAALANEARQPAA
jgi:hypothetical protein